MKAIMVMFDTLNRHMLSPYGCDWTHTPNFKRLAERTASFRHAYVGSMPCMPARRELHTGRYNFLHNSWGPLEPFDDSMPELLQRNGVYTHVVTDHFHYWSDGGASYLNRYQTYDFVRGQQGDAWMGEVEDPVIPESVVERTSQTWRQDWINRKYIQEEEDFPQAVTFSKGLEFIRKNSEMDSWFLQLETFDPHEPFYAPQKYRDLYPHDYKGKHFDWPPYAKVEQTDEEIAHLRYEYAALLSMCDAHLGKVIDLMDELDMWKDTMLIVNTDHGYVLGERDWWGKNVLPFYNEIAHIPMFIWDPRHQIAGEWRESLVQTIDLAPTLLDFFDVAIPPDMQGVPLGDTIATDQPVRKAALFGIHGGHVNVTDGRYVYMRGPQNAENQPLHDYTLMPNHMRTRYAIEELQNIQLAPPFTFTKNVQTMKIATQKKLESHNMKTELFDVRQDPQQKKPLKDGTAEKRMIDHLVREMKKNDAPAEQFERLGL